MQGRAARNPEKKALSQQANTKKRLPKSAHVLFSAPILIARRLPPPRFTNIKFEE
jgi:hypothetical protein